MNDNGHLTFKEIAKKMNIKEYQVAKIYHNAIHKLKSPALKEKWERIIDTISELNKPEFNIDLNKINKDN